MFTHEIVANLRQRLITEDFGKNSSVTEALMKCVRALVIIQDDIDMDTHIPKKEIAREALATLEKVIKGSVIQS